MLFRSESAGIATAVPMGLVNVSLNIELPEHPHEQLTVNFKAVSWNYFPTMGMTLRLGRMFDERDNGAGTPAVMINEAFARKYWPGLNPIGRRLTGGQVVGVVADAHGRMLSKPAEPEFYTPYQQFMGPSIGAMLVVRTRSDPAAMTKPLRDAIHEVYPDQPVADVATMASRVAESMAEPRLYTVLLGLFAGVALLLTAVGIYGVMAYSVSHRTRELGIRMALGARSGDVLRFVMGNGLLVTCVGAACGIAGAWVLRRYAESLLFGVSSGDPTAFMLAPVVLVSVAVMACYLPARRATRIDPNVALRAE